MDDDEIDAQGTCCIIEYPHLQLINVSCVPDAVQLKSYVTGIRDLICDDTSLFTIIHCELYMPSVSVCEYKLLL